MPNFTLIAIARAIHIVAGITWAGSAFTLGLIVFPLATKHAADGAGRWFGLIAGRAALMQAIAAVLTIVTGIGIFHALHAQDASAGGWLLRSGSLAAVLALLLGIFVGRPTARRLAELQNATSTSSTSEQVALDLSSLRRRATITSRLALALIGFATLAMALFRYTSAIGS